MSNCPQPKPMTGSNLGEQAAHVMQAMGARSCETDSSTLNMSGSISSLFGSMRAQMTANKSSSIGCEQIAQITQEYNKMIANVSCTLRKNTSTVNKRLSAKNSVSILASKSECAEGESSSLDIRCNLDIKQSIDIKFADKISLSSKASKEIQNKVKAGTEKIAEIVQESVSETGGTASGSKYSEQVKSNTNNINYANVVDENVNNISISIDAANNIVIKGCKVRLAGDQCKISQNIVFDIVSSSIVDDAVSQVFGNTAEVMDKMQTTIKQKSEAKGVADMIRANNEGFAPDGMMKLVIILVVLVGGAAFVSKMFFDKGGMDVIKQGMEQKRGMSIDSNTNESSNKEWMIYLGAFLVGISLWYGYHQYKLNLHKNEVVSCIKKEKGGGQICNTRQDLYPFDKCPMCEINPDNPDELSEQCRSCIETHRNDKVQNYLDEMNDDEDW